MVWDLFVGYPWYAEAYSASDGDALVRELPEPPAEAELEASKPSPEAPDAAAALKVASEVYGIDVDEELLSFITGSLTSSFFMEPYEGVLLCVPAGDPVVGVDLASRLIGLAKMYCGFKSTESFLRCVKSYVSLGRPVAVLVEGGELGVAPGPRLTIPFKYSGSKLVLTIGGLEKVVSAEELARASAAYHETLRMPWRYSAIVFAGRERPRVDERLFMFMLGRLTIGDVVTDSMAYGSYAARLLGSKLKGVSRLEERVRENLVEALRELASLRSRASHFASSRLVCTHRETMSRLLSDVSALYSEASRHVSLEDYKSAATMLARASVLERSLGELMIDALRGEAPVKFVPSSSP